MRRGAELYASCRMAQANQRTGTVSCQQLHAGTFWWCLEGEPSCTTMHTTGSSCYSYSVTVTYPGTPSGSTSGEPGGHEDEKCGITN